MNQAWCLTMPSHYLIQMWINSLRPSDAIWRHKSGSTLAQAMAWCLTAPSHYLNQCWLRNMSLCSFDLLSFIMLLIRVTSYSILFFSCKWANGLAMAITRASSGVMQFLSIFGYYTVQSTGSYDPSHFWFITTQHEHIWKWNGEPLIYSTNGFKHARFIHKKTQDTY